MWYIRVWACKGSGNSVISNFGGVMVGSAVLDKAPGNSPATHAMALGWLEDYFTGGIPWIQTLEVCWTTGYL